MKITIKRGIIDYNYVRWRERAEEGHSQHKTCSPPPPALKSIGGTTLSIARTRLRRDGSEEEEVNYRSLLAPSPWWSTSGEHRDHWLPGSGQWHGQLATISQIFWMPSVHWVGPIVSSTFFFAQKDFIHIDQDSYRKVQETKKITKRSSWTLASSSTRTTTRRRNPLQLRHALLGLDGDPKQLGSRTLLGAKAPPPCAPEDDASLVNTEKSSRSS
jgi:hypothetical protein